MEVFDGARTDVQPLLSLAFDEVAEASLVERQRSVGFGQIGAGVHTLRVTIHSAAGEVVASRAASVRVE